jgi:hypothetical protein
VWSLLYFIVPCDDVFVVNYEYFQHLKKKKKKKKKNKKKKKKKSMKSEVFVDVNNLVVGKSYQR